jgi:hypothetical protein
MENRIFSMDNAKAAKAAGYGYLNAIHYMAAYKLAGVGNLCANASAGCIALCLGWHSGQAAMVKHDNDINSVRASRIAKARRFMQDRKAYMSDLIHSIELAFAKANRENLSLCIRLNGSTDIPWEGIKYNGINVFNTFPDVQFVDYTKSYKRMIAFLSGKLPANYFLCFSRSESNWEYCEDILARGGNVSVVFGHGIPKEYNGFPVISGDNHDLLHLNPRGVILGLSPKGRKAKRDASGFVARDYPVQLSHVITWKKAA